MEQGFRLVALLLTLQVGLTGFLIGVTIGPDEKYEHEVSCVPDAVLEDELAERGSAGWTIASARRADTGYSSCYEILWTRET